MKSGISKLSVGLILLFAAVSSYAAGSFIASTVFELVTAAGTLTPWGMTVAFAINMVVSAVITKTFFTPEQSANGFSGSSQNPGNRLQIPPATDNKLPVVYGQAWLGGTVTDLSITSNNQSLFYVMSISEVTDNGSDQITFGDVYWGGKKCLFENEDDATRVTRLYDESADTYDTAIDGYLYIYLYTNGSYSGQNTSKSAISVMQTDGLIYTWDSQKLMTNCAFAIVQINYSTSVGTTSLQQTKFQVTNSRTNPGDCFYDYLTNSVYGAAIPASAIDTTSLAALNTYSNGSFAYTDSDGNPATQPRFRFDGVLDTNRTVMDNLQDMASSCDCLIKYNEISGTWGVIVQSPAYSIAMDINDSNIVSAIQVTPLDIAASYNVIECKFPDSANQDSFNTSTFDLAQIDPALLFPNEPVNKQSVSLNYVNNSVRAQYIANRMLKSGREDLQVNLAITFVGIQLEAGDVVTLTNANYGWVAKEFRVMKVTEDFASDGSVTVKLILTEFNSAVYDDVSVTEFQPSPNTGLPDPLVFGSISAPVVSNLLPSAVIPSLDVTITTPGSGITQYAEVWYSAFQFPTSSQLIFAGTTAVQPSGVPYDTNTTMPVVTVTNLPAGRWYFFARMVNSLGTSAFSPASSVVQWRPLSFQFTERYLMIAYADTSAGVGFSLLPTNKSYFGYLNQSTTNPNSNPSAYTWIPVSPTFGSSNFLLYTNRGSRKATFASGQALFASQTGAYVPADTSKYDQSIWAALQATINSIDLDARTGQLLTVGTSSISATDGLIRVTNTQNGFVVAQLEKFLNFGAGVKYKTSAVAALTIDEYGRVVGFSQPDVFGYTETVFDATAGQTTFAVSHVVGNVLVFQNGALLDTSDYSETSSTIVLSQPADLNDKIVVLNMKATSTDPYYEPLNITIASSASNSVTYSTTSSPYQKINAGDLISFANSGTPTTYTVSSVNYSTRVITFTTSISGATAGLPLYRYRAAASQYKPFSRYTDTLVAATNYSPTEWEIRSGFEMVFINGIYMTALDYNITAGDINTLPDVTNGKITIIQFNENNLGVVCSGYSNTLTTTLDGIVDYGYAHDVLAFELYGNGALFARGYDFTDTESIYQLSQTPTNSYTLLQQQSFARNGAA